MNPDYAKTVLRDENGIILLPQTTASMVSEEPDRRFVDNVEKALLHALADNQVALEGLASHASNLALLAQNADVILPGASVQESLKGILDNIDALSRITANIEPLIAFSNGSLETTSNTGKNYSIGIDDTSGTPKFVLTEIVEAPPVLEEPIDEEPGI